MKQILLFSLLASTLPVSAALTWTGLGDGISAFQEANWLDDNGNIPAAGTIDPSTAITAATGGLIVINSGIGSPSGYNTGNFNTGTANILIGGGKIFASVGALGLGGTAVLSASISGASTVNVDFLFQKNATLDGASTIRLRGAGNSLNTSTVNFLDTASFLQFDLEDFTEFNTEHASKVTYLGNPLAFGADPFLFEPGDNALATAFNGADGVQITVIPEPSSAALLGLGLTLVALRRQRRIVAA